MGEVVGYVRVSTTGQKLDIQLEALEKAGVTKRFKEKVPGVAKDRPQLHALLDYVRAGDTVIVTKLDRIARNTRHLLEVTDQLKVRGVTFRVLNNNLDTYTPNGKLMLTMLGAIAEFERDMMLERRAEGIAKAKAEGKYKGRKPTARAKAKEVFELAAQGHTRQSIADKLGIGVASVYRVLKEYNPNKIKSVSKTKPKEKAKKTIEKKPTGKKIIAPVMIADRLYSIFRK